MRKQALSELGVGKLVIPGHVEDQLEHGSFNTTMTAPSAMAANADAYAPSASRAVEMT